ncbi:MAG: hypothetical protein ACM3SQ_11560 [Betaproteobacteria bacterium]
MIIRCKHCGGQVSLTERESSQIAADLDRRYSWEEQASLVIQAVCADCWPIEEQSADDGASRRVQFVSSRT